MRNKTNKIAYVIINITNDIGALAVASAKKAASWGKLSSPERGEYLRKAADILEQRLDEIAETEVNKYTNEVAVHLVP